MLDAVIAHPLVLLVSAWLISRLQILAEVKTRLGAQWRFSVYLDRRWMQVLRSALITLFAYGAGVGLGAPEWLISAAPLNPPLTDTQALAGLAIACGLAGDQVVERIENMVHRRAHREENGDDPNGDITRIVKDLQREGE
jgi:hypothetical protein